MRGRDAFAAGFQAAIQHYRIESSSEIQEIEIAGDWAYCWNHLSVTVTPLQAGSPARRPGYTITILPKKPPTGLGFLPPTQKCLRRGDRGGFFVFLST